MKLETARAENANPARIVIAEGKVRTYTFLHKAGLDPTNWAGCSFEHILKLDPPFKSA